MKSSHDRLSIHEFSRELGYGLSSAAVAAVQDPLAVTIDEIERNPEHLQSLLLARVLSALTSGVGHFRKTEVFGLDKGARTLAVALSNVRAAGGLPTGRWENAVAAAGAAHVRALGDSPSVPTHASETWTNK